MGMLPSPELPLVSIKKGPLLRAAIGATARGSLGFVICLSGLWSGFWLLLICRSLVKSYNP